MMVCAGCFTLHFLLIIIVSLHDISSILPGDASVLPQGSNKVWRRIETITTALLAERLSPSNPLRQGLAAYTNGAGIELGYSYFAPSIPGNAKLVFELHYPDGRVEYDLPHVGGAAAGYRVATLLDNLQDIHYARLRNAIVQSLVSSVWQEHPDAVVIRAVFGVASLPTAEEFRAGAKGSYRLLSSYDFRLRSKTTQPEKR